MNPSMCLCSLLKTSASDNVVAASRKTSKHPLSSTFKNMAKRGRTDEEMKKGGRTDEEMKKWGRTDEEMTEEMKKWDAVAKKAADEWDAAAKKWDAAEKMGMLLRRNAAAEKMSMLQMQRNAAEKNAAEKWDAAAKNAVAKEAADEQRAATGEKAAKKARDSMLKTLKFLREARNMAAEHEGTEKYAKAVKTLVGIMQSLGMGGEI